MKNFCMNSEIKFVIPTLSSILPNTQKNTKNPQINKSVEILFLIPVPIMLPNSERAILFLSLRSGDDELFNEKELLFFLLKSSFFCEWYFLEVVRING